MWDSFMGLYELLSFIKYPKKELFIFFQLDAKFFNLNIFPIASVCSIEFHILAFVMNSLGRNTSMFYFVFNFEQFFWKNLLESIGAGLNLTHSTQSEIPKLRSLRLKTRLTSRYVYSPNRLELIVCIYGTVRSHCEESREKTRKSKVWTPIPHGQTKNINFFYTSHFVIVINRSDKNTGTYDWWFDAMLIILKLRIALFLLI